MWGPVLHEYAHGINMLPFTPITEELLKPSYVQDAYPQMAEILKRDSPPVADPWRGFLGLGHAVINANGAWREILSLNQFDTGNSLANSLWWVATRPGFIWSS